MGQAACCSDDQAESLRSRGRRIRRERPDRRRARRRPVRGRVRRGAGGRPSALGPPSRAGRRPCRGAAGRARARCAGRCCVHRRTGDTAWTDARDPPSSRVASAASMRTAMSWGSSRTAAAHGAVPDGITRLGSRGRSPRQAGPRPPSRVRRRGPGAGSGRPRGDPASAVPDRTHRTSRSLSPAPPGLHPQP
jgi:hypothetical protein